MKTVTSATIVRVLEGIFGGLGLPYSLRSDNGSQFVSDAFQNFLRDNGVEHRRITPLEPRKWGASGAWRPHFNRFTSFRV